MQRLGTLFVVSAPSGAGKTTLCNSLRQRDDFTYSISCTTRPPRPGEADGEDYFFLSRGAFEEKIRAGDFLEHATVHGNFYGTLKKTVFDSLDQGKDILLDIDIQGAAAIRTLSDARLKSCLADIFIMPPTFAELERRLRKRQTESEEQIRLRLENARQEMRHWSEYKYTILSGSIEEDLDKFRAIMKAERYHSSRLILGEI
ncbi:MAG: guanylate kinase [Verrucomicrobiae bacterium]|nr:guanylate kinase [Verrucomicrobiae bacterium]